MNTETIYEFGTTYYLSKFQGWCEHDKMYVSSEQSSFSNRQYIKCPLCLYRCFFNSKNMLHSAALVRMDGLVKTTWNFYQGAVSMTTTKYIRWRLTPDTIAKQVYERKTNKLSLDSMNGFIDKIGILK